MFKLSSIGKAVTQALNAAPDVDELSKSLGTPSVEPRLVAEYGGVHGATCLDYDPTQRVLAVGVDVGVKILGADGLEALLPTLHHVEPALSVEFVPSTARVARLSVDGGVDVWCLRTQTLLASTRWPEELTVARGVRGTPFFFLGEASGAMRVAAVQAGGDGGVLAPRSYAVAPGAARPDEPDARAALVAIEPRPGAEHARVLLAYADGALTLWDLRRAEPAAVAAASASREGAAADAAWVGGGGDALATAHETGAVVLWTVPSEAALTRAGRGTPQLIVPTCTIRPGSSTSPGEDSPSTNPARRVVARALGGPGAPFRESSSASSSPSASTSASQQTSSRIGGVLAVLGGEPAGRPDPPWLTPLGPRANAPAERAATATLPWNGPTRDARLAPPRGRPEEVEAIVVLSEGGQIHVHDARGLWDAPGGEGPEGPEGPEGGGSDSASVSALSVPPTAKQPIARFPAAEATDPLPRLRPECPPAAIAASPELVRRAESEPASDPLPRDAWGAAWPLSGGAASRSGVGESDADANASSRSASARRVVAAAAGDGAGSVRVSLEGGGWLRSVAVAKPGPNAGVSADDRAVTAVHLARGGEVLVVGRASGAAEIHLAGRLCDRRASRSIRQLDSGLDLSAAGSGGERDPAEDHPGGAEEETRQRKFSGYRLAGELGAHAAKITCAATDARCETLAVGDAAGAVSVVDLRAGLLKFHTKHAFGRQGTDHHAEVGVAAAAFCPPVVGTVDDDEEEEEEEAAREADGSGSPLEGEEENVTTKKERRKKRAAARDVGAATLALASSGSALAFIDVATGAPVGKPCHPKTPSRALAIAPLTAAGVPFGAPRRTSARKMTKTKTKTPLGEPGAEENWLGEEDESDQSSGEEDDQVVSGSTYHTPRGFSRTALVAVASAEALRVYPANGAAKGERHTVKKATPEEPLAFAALVAPRDPSDDDRPDGPARPCAFAAVTARGRLLTFALPSLAPLAAIGPLPPLSAADGVGFCADGVAVAAAGSGASLAVFALAPRPAGPRARPESGATLHDDELAAAAEAAEAAARAMAEASAAGGGAAGGGAAASPLPTRVDPRQPAPGSSSRPVAKDLGKAASHALRGDARSALASFGSVMRGAKAKAKDAMEKAKERAKEAVDLAKGSAGGAGAREAAAREEREPDDGLGDWNRRLGPADLAVLFAEAESRRPTPSKAVAAAATAASAARAASVAGTPPSDPSGPSPRASDSDAARAELFRQSSGGPPSRTGSGSFEPRVNTADEIRAKYGKGPGGGGVSELRGNAEETRNKLLERGEKLSSLQDKTAKMQNDAEDFHAMAQKLAKQNQSWW